MKNIPETHGTKLDIYVFIKIYLINNGRRYADRGVWGTKSALFGVNSNLI